MKPATRRRTARSSSHARSNSLPTPIGRSEALNLAATANLGETGAQVLGAGDRSGSASAVSATKRWPPGVQTRPSGANEAIANFAQERRRRTSRQGRPGARPTWRNSAAVKSLVVKGLPMRSRPPAYRPDGANHGGALALLKWIDAKELDDATASSPSARPCGTRTPTSESSSRVRTGKRTTAACSGAAMKSRRHLETHGGRKARRANLPPKLGRHCKRVPCHPRLRKKLGPT